MASSGTYTNAFKTGYSLELRWNTVSQDIANNTSNVKVETWLVNTYSTSSSATKNGSITINGSTGTYTFTVGNGVINKKLFERTVTVGHNSDGTKTVALSTYADIELTLSGSYVGRVSVSGSPTLNTIPRASTFSSFPTSITAGTSFSYSISRASSSFTHEVEYDFGNNNVYQTGIGTSGTYTIPLSWLNAIPNAASGPMLVTLHTYNGSTYIGNSYDNPTVSAPASVVPTITSVTAARVDGPVPPAWGVYVQNKSSANVTINGAAGAYGSTITKYETTMSTTTKTGQTTNFTLPTSGTVTFTGKVTDSRGRTATSTVNINVEPYTSPAIISANLNRSTAAGVDDANGTYGEVLADYTYSLVDGSGTAKNSATTLVEYKILGGPTWTNAGTFSDNVPKVFGGGGLSTDNQYEVRLSVTDAFATTTWSAILNTAFVTMDFLAGGHGIAFGKVASLTDTVESDFDFLLNGKLDVIGKIRASGGFDTPKIPPYANLNDYVTPGQWFNSENSEVATLVNKPPLDRAGALVVMETSTSAGTGAGVSQFWHSYGAATPDSYIYRRRLYNGSWSAWGKVSDGVEWPKPRRLGMTATLSIPAATDYRTWNWAGMANDPGDVAGGITYAEGGFTVPQAGVYTISTVIRWLDGAFTQNAELKLFTGPSLNNTTQDECMLFHSHQYMHCAWTIYLEAGHRAEVWLRQISGTSRTIGGNPAYNWYQIARTG